MSPFDPSDPLVADFSALEGVEFVSHVMHIAPEVSSDESQVWVLAVDTVILALTLLGAFFILGRLSWNEFKRTAATLRVRLVQSLIFTDVVMGVVGLIGCGMSLNKTPLVYDTQLCDGLGIMMVAVIFSQHLWTLSLAFATFMILVHPLHNVTSLIEKYWFWLWPVIWAISFGISVLGYFLYGYGPAGGICYYLNDSGLFGELIQFMPRAIVFLVIALLYGKLYVFLRRPDKIRSGYSDSPSHSSLSKLKGSWFNSRGSKVRKPKDQNNLFGRANRTIIVDGCGSRVSGISADHSSSAASFNPTENPKAAPESQDSPQVQTPERRLTHSKSLRGSKRNTLPPNPDLPPWEHVELPVFQVDGQRFGGIESSVVTHEVHRGWRDWHGFPGKKRTSTTNSLSSTTQTPITSPTRGLFENPLVSPNNTLFEDRISPTAAYFEDHSAKPNYSPTNALGTSTPPLLLPVTETERSPLTRSLGSDEGTVTSLTTTAVDSSAPQSPKSPKDLFKDVASSPTGRRRSGELSGSASSASPELEGAMPRPPPTALSPASASSLMYEGFNPNRRGSIPDGTLPFRRASGFALPSGFPLPPGFSQSASRLGASRGSISIPGNIADLPRAATPASSTTQFNKDVEKGGEDGLEDEDDSEDEGAWDLMRMLQEPPPQADKDPFAIQTKTSDKVEYVQESMAAYLNRKTALLMLWFPLGYVLLFSVSLIRIIYDFVGNPPIELRALSRWMMFGQGLLDAIIYGVVEWHTKRVVRRRVRRGTFSPHHSHASNGHHSGLASKLRHMVHPHSHHHRTNPGNGDGSNAQTASVQRNLVSPTVSFAEPDRSIIQRMDIKRDTNGSNSSRDV